MSNRNGKRHRFQQYNEYIDEEPRRAPRKKKHAVLYFTYIISGGDDVANMFQPGTYLTDGRFYKTAFETVLWLESFIMKIKPDDNGKYYYAIYQVEPAHKNIKPTEYANGLTAYNDSSVKIVRQYTTDEIAAQIRKEIAYKDIPKKNQYPEEFSFAQKIYANMGHNK